MIRVYHHNDADGLASAFLIAKECVKKNKEYELIEMDYSKSFPIENITSEDTVYILDYSIEPAEMIKLLRITDKVIWIDHHKSAIERYKDWSKSIVYPDIELVEGIRQVGISGCALTYLYLEGYDYTSMKEEDKLNRMYYDFDLAPLYLQLINDWDVWNHNIPETKPFMTALNIKLDISIIADLDEDAYEMTPLGRCMIGDLERTSLAMQLIHNGDKYIEYRKVWSEQLRDRYGFTTFIYDADRDRQLEAYVLNIGNANSEFFGGKINQYDLIISVCFDGERFRYSLYSNKDYVDCGKLARQFGVDNGGGHPGAAGFIHKDLLFRKSI